MKTSKAMTDKSESYASVWDAIADTPEQAANLRARRTDAADRGHRERDMSDGLSGQVGSTSTQSSQRAYRQIERGR
jgi:hypothetical protein